MIIGLLMITGLIFIKYKPAYRVTVNGETIGYIANRNEFNSKVDEYINTNEEYVAFKTVSGEKSYNLEFVEKDVEINEEKVLGYVRENTETIYTMYAIVVNDEVTQSVKTEEEAKKIIDDLNSKYEKYNINIGIRQIYSTEKPDIVEGTVAIAQITNDKINPIVTSRSGKTIRKTSNTKTSTKTTTNSTQTTSIDVKRESSANGITFSCQPVSGKITSKFGARSSRRSSSHTGLDIATSKGTGIKVVASGTVTFSANSGSYGKLVKVSHGNGVETWYAHCNELYVSAGQTVSAGQVIAAVGSTGNSSGPHLHLEIRINGTAVNPQKYMY